MIEPARETPAGVPRLQAYVERFLGHVEEGVFPGGCFFVSAVSELDAHPGPVRDGAMAFSQRWLGLLAEEVAAGQTAGELGPGADPPQVAFELNAFMVLGNMQFVASGGPRGPRTCESRRREPAGRGAKARHAGRTLSIGGALSGGCRSYQPA